MSRNGGIPPLSSINQNRLEFGAYRDCGIFSKIYHNPCKRQVFGGDYLSSENIAPFFHTSSLITMGHVSVQHQQTAAETSVISSSDQARVDREDERSDRRPLHRDRPNYVHIPLGLGARHTASSIWADEKALLDPSNHLRTL